MKLPDGLYDILKWITLVLIPALSTAYLALAEPLGLPAANTVAAVCAALCTFLGTVLGISTAEYNRQKE